MIVCVDPEGLNGGSPPRLFQITRILLYKSQALLWSLKIWKPVAARDLSNRMGNKNWLMLVVLNCFGKSIECFMFNYFYVCFVVHARHLKNDNVPKNFWILNRPTVVHMLFTSSMFKINYYDDNSASFSALITVIC